MAKRGTATATPSLRFPEFREAPAFFETTVGQISNHVFAGGTPDTTKKTNWNGQLRWMNSGELNLKRVHEVQGRITNEGLDNSSTKEIPAQCVLIGLAGQGKTRGTVAMNMVPLCTNQSIAAIYPNEGVFDSDFLYHNLDSRYEELRSLSAGGEGRGGLNLQIIKSLAIFLPSLAEQQKIADCLTSLDEVIAAQGRKVEALKAHKRGLMQQLFPREGETRPRLRFPEFRNAPEWSVKSFAKLYEFMPTNTFSRDQLNYANGMVKNIHYGDIHTKFATQFRIDAELVPFVNLEQSLAKLNPAAYCREGDMIFADASEDLTDVGKSIELVRLNDEKLLSGSHTILARQRQADLVLGFGAYLFKSRNIRAQIKKEAQGTKVMAISPNKLADIEIRFPRDKDEQQRIADCLSSLDTRIGAESEKLVALKTHKQGLMQRLFPTPETD